jgi:hypothetical protein
MDGGFRIPFTGQLQRLLEQFYNDSYLLRNGSKGTERP